MKDKVGQSCDVGIFVGFCFQQFEPRIIGLCLNMIYRSGEKNFGYSSESLKFNIRGEVWLQKEPASQAHKVDPRFHPTLNQRLDVESTLFQAVSLLCA